MRIQKYLSRAGVASRREAERLVSQGRVRVNGEILREPGRTVDPRRDRIEVDGRRVELPEPRWILLHKPAGVDTTRHDPHAEATVYDLLPSELGGLSYVGRLDRDTEGLLLLTNEGDAVHGLLHPSRRVSRTYRAVVEGALTEEEARRLEAGVDLEDGPARPEAVRVLGSEPDGGTSVSLTLREGRKREVRRIFEAVGRPVRHLLRTGFGPQELGNLPAGQWRELGAEEVRVLRAAAGLPDPDEAGDG